MIKIKYLNLEVETNSLKKLFELMANYKNIY
jgi:hypothetical protein